MAQAGLYIHVPFCKRKCDYCDFYSIVSAGGELPDFVSAVVAEMNLYREHPVFSQLTFSSLYLGGGTPSLASSDCLRKILQAAFSTFAFAPDAEITLEANPESVTLEKLISYRQLGINRLSLGVQSLHEAALKKLGRLHTAQQARDAIDWARQAGFENLSLDLIFAIPGQTLPQWEDTLRNIILLNPQHISAYCLTIEAGTRLAQRISTGSEIPAAEELQRDLYLTAIEILKQSGFLQYEISNFAKAGFECLHNLTYWNYSPYLGLGPAAHSFFDNSRQWNISDVTGYQQLLSKQQLPIAGREKLTRQQQEFEFIFLHLRTNRGLNLQIFEKLFDRSFPAYYAPVLEKLEAYPGKKLFLITENHFRLTAEGFVLFDEICSYFA